MVYNIYLYVQDICKTRRCEIFVVLCSEITTASRDSLRLCQLWSTQSVGF